MAKAKPSQSFDISTASDLFRALDEAVSAFLEDSMSTWKGVACAMLAWHLGDWIWAEHRPKLRDQSLSEFQARVRDECPALALMHDIATWTKHRGINWTPLAQKTDKHQGGFSRGFSPAFDISGLRMTLSDTGAILDVEVGKARDYWRGLFKSELEIVV